MGDDLHSLLRQLKLHGHVVDDLLNVGEVVCKGMGCCVNHHVGVAVDGCS